MIEIVDAEAFVKQVRGDHATQPYVLLCRDAAGRLADVYTKITWQQCPLHGLVSEVICSLLAQELGLLVPQPVYVELQDDFIDSLRATQPIASARLNHSCRPAFGTKSVGLGYSDAQAPPRDIPASTLAEIWAFDRLTLNGDRRISKPNCLTNGTDMYLIDHEKALNCVFLGGMLNPYPWTAGAIESADQATPHLFRPHIQGYADTLGRLKQAWMRIDNEMIDAFAASLPSGWSIARQEITDATSYLKLLRANLDEAFERLTGALQ